VLGLLADFHDCKGEVRRRGLSLEGECGRSFVERNDQSCGGDESKKIKMEVRKKEEGEDNFKVKIGRNFSFCSPTRMEMRSGRLRGFKYEI
jgi:hypothetical protein